MLEEMIGSGLWSSTHRSKRLILEEHTATFDLSETIYLSQPPFHTVDYYAKGPGKEYWDQHQTILHGVKPALALIIAQLGWWSPDIIVLDYRHARFNPCVLKLPSTEVSISTSSNNWIKIADDFPTFAAKLRFPS